MFRKEILVMLSVIIVMTRGQICSNQEKDCAALSERSLRMFRKGILVMLSVITVMTRGQMCSNQEKVYFQAWNSKTVEDIKSGHIFVFESTNTNRGGHYDATSGIFTAPRDGPYVFTWTVVTTDGHSINVDLYQNSKAIARAQADGAPGPQNSSGSNTVVLDLKTGDEVNLRCRGWMSQNQRELVGQAHSTFSGWAL